MKTQLWLLIIAIELCSFKAYSQVTVSVSPASPASINSCLDAAFNFTITNHSGSTLSSVDLGVTFQNSLNIDVSQYSQNSSNYYLVQSNIQNINDGDTYNGQYIIHIKCNAIIEALNQSILHLTDQVLLFNHSTQTAFTGSGYALTYNVNVPSLVVENISPVPMYTHESQTPMLRTITYKNNGNDFSGYLHFSDDIPNGNPNNCSNVYAIDHFIVKIQRCNNCSPCSTCTINTISTNSLSAGSFDITLSSISETLKTGDLLIVEEYIKIIGCLLNCNATSTVTLLWGCSSNDHCKSLIQTPNIRRDNAQPDVKIIKTAPTDNYSGLYWDYSCPSTTTNCTFRIFNHGNMDATSVKIILSTNNSQFYYVNADIIYANPQTINGTIFSNPVFQNPSAHNQYPVTLDANSTTISASSDRRDCIVNSNGQTYIDHVTFVIDFLSPGDAIDFNFSYFYCCSQNDDGSQTNGANIFNKGKYLNRINLYGSYIFDCNVGALDVSSIPNGMHNITGNGSSGADLDLKQEHEQPVADMTATPNGCSTAPQEFKVHNVAFVTSPSNANIFCHSYTGDESNMTAEGKIRVVWKLDAGLDLDFNHLPQMDNGTIVWNPITPLTTISTACSTSGSCSNNDCCTQNIYEAIFNIDDLSVGHTLQDLQEFLSDSWLHFYMVACCCCSSQKGAPTYSISTYLFGDANSCSSPCWIPMSSVGGAINVHCPGCQAPGIIVDGFTLERNINDPGSFGYIDTNDNGLIDNVSNTKINSSTSLSDLAGVARNHSIVGDSLLGVLNAHFQDGSSPYDYNDIKTSWTLDHLYLEQKIPCSDIYNLNLAQVDFTINRSSNPLWSGQIPLSFIDARNSDHEKFFYNFSLGMVKTISGFPSTYDFEPGDQFIVSSHFRVCGNPGGEINADIDDPQLDASANVCHSEVTNVMYLSGTNQTFNAYANVEVGDGAVHNCNAPFSSCSSLSISCGGTQVSCNTCSDGTVSVTATGGSPSYGYLWSNGANSSSNSGLSGGSYTVTVTDQNGCSAICCYTILNPADIYLCQTWSSYHHFYNVLSYSYGLYYTGNTVEGHEYDHYYCQHSAFLTTFGSIGGKAINVFPYEFRPAPFPQDFKITIPAYNSLPTSITSANSESYTYIRKYHISTCSPSTAMNKIMVPTGYITHTVSGNVANVSFSYVNASEALLGSFLTPATYLYSCIPTVNNGSLPPIAGDEYFQQTVVLELDPECSQNYAQWDNTYLKADFGDINNSCSFPPAHTAYVPYISPGNARLGPPNPPVGVQNISTNIHAEDKNICWDIEMGGTSVAQNFFIYFPNNSKYNILPITSTNGCSSFHQVLPCGNQGCFYALDDPSHNNNGCHYNLCVEENICSTEGELDSLQFMWGWNCADFPTELSSSVCNIDTVYLHFTQEPSAFDFKFPEAMYSICSQTELEVDLTSSLSGGLDHFLVTLTLPQDLSYSNSYSLFYKPTSASNQVSLSNLSGQPTYANGKWQWDLHGLDSNQNFGSNNLLDDGEELILKFNVKPECNYGGTPPLVSVTAKKYCGDDYPSTDNTKPPLLWTGPISVSCSCCGNFASISGSNIFCKGQQTILCASSGTNFTYSWNTGETSSCINAVSAEAYSVVIIGSNGCTSTASITTSFYPETYLSPASSSVRPVSSYGGNNGSITLTITGGTSPFTYTWSNGATTQNITDLSAGIYTVTVTDSFGCITTQSYPISQPPPYCSGGFQTRTQGFWHRIQNWPCSSNEFYNTFPSGLSVGCSSGYTDIFTSPTAVTTFLSSVGGTPKVLTSSAINPPTSNNNELAKQLVTLTLNTGFDRNTCFSSNSTSLIDMIIATGIFQGWTVQAVFDEANSALGGCGSVYSYSQLNNVITSINQSFDNGTCPNGSCGILTCPTNSPVFQESPEFIVACFVNPGTCNNGFVSSISTEIQGGTPPYNYLWSTGDTTAGVSGIPDGYYAVMVTDSSDTLVAYRYAYVSADTSTTATAYYEVSFSNCVASFMDLSQEGADGFTESWSWDFGDTLSESDNFSDQQNPTHVFVGTETHNVCLTTTFSDGTLSCSSTYCNEIPALITASYSVTNVSCYSGNNGSVEVIAANGTTPYSYLWSTGDTMSAITSLKADTYSIITSDANGCTVNSKVTVTQPSAVLSTSLSGANVSCKGGNDGLLIVTASGGTSPYIYNWNTNASTTAINGLVAGTYVVTVTDANGCTAIANATVTEPVSALAIVINVTSNVSCFNGNNGSSSASASGGTSSYSYYWSTNATTSAISGLKSGTYSVTVTDAHNCKSTTSTAITQPSSSLGSNISVVANVSCRNGNNGSASVSANGGTNSYSYRWNNNATKTSISGLTAGTYSVTVTDAHNCVSIATASITQPSAALNASCGGAHVTCNSGSNASCSVTASGGTPGYTYVWSTGGTTTALTGRTAATYSVTVIDVHSCTASCAFTVTQPSALTAIANSNTPVCDGNVINLSSTVSGGTTVYVYSWSGPNSFTSTVANPSISNAVTENGGSYSLIVTDAHGCSCTSTSSVTVNSCNTTLNIICYLEGFYSGSHIMRPTLYNLGYVSDNTASDTIKVNLWSPRHLSDNSPDYSEKVILHKDGTASVTYPGSAVGNYYYIAVQHRNTLETWSHDSLLFSSTNSYDFSTHESQAYDDGFNPPMKYVSPSTYAFYSGDVNHDGTVDAIDMSIVDNDASNFAFGYNDSDCTGDGSSDAADETIIDNNNELMLYLARPY